MKKHEWKIMEFSRYYCWIKCSDCKLTRRVTTVEEHKKWRDDDSCDKIIAKKAAERILNERTVSKTSTPNI